MGNYRILAEDCKIADVTENRLDKILTLIGSNPKITTIELAKELNVTWMTIHRGLEILKSADKLRRMGGDKGGHWEVW